MLFLLANSVLWTPVQGLVFFIKTENYINIFFADSETTEDEGGDQFETKEEDSGDVEDQAVPTGILLVYWLIILGIF